MCIPKAMNPLKVLKNPLKALNPVNQIKDLNPVKKTKKSLATLGKLT